MKDRSWKLRGCIRPGMFWFRDAINYREDWMFNQGIPTLRMTFQAMEYP